MANELGLRIFKKIDVAFPSKFDEKTNFTRVDTEKGEYIIVTPDLTEGMLTIIPPEGTPTVLEDESLRVYQLCDGSRSFDDIVDILKKDYPDEDVEEKVRIFIKSLVDEEIISW
ncbi:MAG: PqqD family peptide modification chaperone [Halobacteriota archaeon]|nr:PqqD family peptide modification chaperone [Halobacteriota archaeon]